MRLLSSEFAEDKKTTVPNTQTINSEDSRLLSAVD